MRDFRHLVSTPVDYSCGCGQPAGGGINQIVADGFTEAISSAGPALTATAINA